MADKREYRRLTFGRKLDERRLRAILAETMRQAAKEPEADAAPVRPESVFIEADKTTVYLSGNDAGLDAVAKAVREAYEGARFHKARRVEAKRQPHAQQTRKRK